MYVFRDGLGAECYRQGTEIRKMDWVDFCIFIKKSTEFTVEFAVCQMLKSF